jgi:hypothetical protein
LTARPSSFSSRAIRREPRKGHAVNSSSMEKILFRGITGILMTCLLNNAGEVLDVSELARAGKANMPA